MKFREITPEDYSKVLELDRKVYPTKNPVTSEILDKWYQRNPEFGLVFEENEKSIGLLIAIPLNKEGWTKLINGDLSESEIDSRAIFNNSQDKEIGLHIYHIEKFSDKKNFYKEALEGLDLILDGLRKQNPGLRVIGFSGLAVTSGGINLSYNKFNCRERNFINSEHILKKDNELKVIEGLSQKQLSKMLKDGYEYVNRCKMLVLYPNEESIVWDFLKPK